MNQRNSKSVFRWAALAGAATLAAATLSLGAAVDGASASSARVRIDAYAWASVDSGSNHTCGTRITHELWCWGLNDQGQLGNGTTANSSNPHRVGVGRYWAQVTVGWIPHLRYPH